MLKLSWELCAGLRRISDTSQTARPNLADTGQRLCIICLSEALHAWESGTDDRPTAASRFAP